MCACTPNVRTPFCGKPGCTWPEQKPVDGAPTPKGHRSAPGHVAVMLTGHQVSALHAVADQWNCDIHEAARLLLVGGLTEYPPMAQNSSALVT